MPDSAFDREIVEIEESFCMGCGHPGSIRTCVKCKADELGASYKATAVLVHKDEFGNLTHIEEVWLH